MGTEPETTGALAGPPTLRRFLQGRSAHAGWPFLRPLSCATLERYAHGWRDLGPDAASWRSDALKLTIATPRGTPFTTADLETGILDEAGLRVVRLADAHLKLDPTPSYKTGDDVGGNARGSTIHRAELGHPAMARTHERRPATPDGRLVTVHCTLSDRARAVAIGCPHATWEEGLDALVNLMAIEGRERYTLTVSRSPVTGSQVARVQGPDRRGRTDEMAVIDHVWAVAHPCLPSPGQTIPGDLPAISFNVAMPEAATLRTARKRQARDGTAHARLQAWLRTQCADGALVAAYGFAGA